MLLTVIVFVFKISVVIVSSQVKLQVVIRLETIKSLVLIVSLHVNILFTVIVVASKISVVIVSSQFKLLIVEKLETFRYSVLILLSQVIFFVVIVSIFNEPKPPSILLPDVVAESSPNLILFLTTSVSTVNIFETIISSLHSILLHIISDVFVVFVIVMLLALISFVVVIVSLISIMLLPSKLVSIFGIDKVVIFIVSIVNVLLSVKPLPLSNNKLLLVNNT